jgi:hypothetical protein
MNRALHAACKNKNKNKNARRGWARTKQKKTERIGLFYWWSMRDSNPRPFPCHGNALASCANAPYRMAIIPQRAMLTDTISGMSSIRKFPFRASTQTVRLVWLVGLIILVLGGWLWWDKVYNNPDHVFWSMINNSLVTNSVTRITRQSSDGQSQDQYTRILFGSQNASRTLGIRQQDQGNTHNTVVQEVIGTPTTDYVGFPTVKTSSSGPDYSSIRGVWGKSNGQSSDAQNFKQAIFGTVPFAPLNPSQRAALINEMKVKNVYAGNFIKAAKQKQNGRSVFVYSLNINPTPYFETMQQFGKILGLGQVSGLDPAQYAGVGPLSVQFTVDVLSRQLTKIHYTTTEQDETYTSYGITAPIELPARTIPLNELQKRVESIQ